MSGINGAEGNHPKKTVNEYGSKDGQMIGAKPEVKKPSVFDEIRSSEKTTETKDSVSINKRIEEIMRDDGVVSPILVREKNKIENEIAELKKRLDVINNEIELERLEKNNSTRKNKSLKDIVSEFSE